MKYFFLSFFLLYSFGNSLLCQTPIPIEDEEGPDRVLRISIIHFLDPLTPGPHFSYEHRIRKNTYLRHELGLFFNFNYDSNAALQDLEGFRVRTSRRQYRRNFGKRSQRYYWEVAVDYRFTNALVIGDFRSGGGTFNQRLEYGITQHSLTINYIRGATYMLGKNWQFDIGVGVGIRGNHRRYSEIPEATFFDTNGGLFWQYGRRLPYHLILSTPMIFALGHHF